MPLFRWSGCDLQYAYLGKVGVCRDGRVLDRRRLSQLLVSRTCGRSVDRRAASLIRGRQVAMSVSELSVLVGLVASAVAHFLMVLALPTLTQVVFYIGSVIRDLILV